ncbi:putative porin [Herbaspirillum sp. Sphag1AN]|uniref:porin n=1 Tax=unclassified Herbaspirillum TaxID=2624150 RepID=UPI00183F917D|nr:MULTISPECIES: porin [unclassified Herbaspirillum]MBB3214552.1 putative porin [Herbaspirillum sp. Sphag1AN]MBB3247698.1 putative porin [Herbaspirillum sp. Sphag64]
MKKRHGWMVGGLLVTAMGISTSASAQSNVTIYGVVDDALVYTNNQGGLSNVYLRTGNLSSSKLGFKGVEDLGGGLQAIFTLENGFDTNTGAFSSSNVLFNRQAFVGLNSQSAGTLTVGRQYTPYYLYVGAIGPTTVLTGATGAHPGDVDDLDTSVRSSNSVTYSTPVFGGAQVSALYGFGETAGSTSTGNAYSLAGKYDVNAWNFALGYQHFNIGTGSTTWSSSTATANIPSSAINAGYQTANNVQMIAAAARYTINKLMVGVNYSNAQYRPGTGSLFTQPVKFQTAGLISTYQWSPQMVLAAGYSYTYANAGNGISNAANYHQVSFEETYSFSPRTAIYFLQAYQLAGGQTLSSTGSIINAVAAVGDSQNSSASSGKGQAVVMLGIRHSF